MAAELLEGPSFFSFNLTVETPIDIDTAIYMTEPDDLPLLFGVNSDGTPVLSATPTRNTEFFWLEESVPLPRATLNEALDASETDVTLLTGEAVKFAVGDQIRIDDELMDVTDINTSTDVLTVVRGSATVNNTTAATHVTGAEVVGVGSVLIEGAIGSANFQGRDKFSNYCQIWSKKMNVSGTEQVIPKYGIASEVAHQMMNMVHHNAVGMEQAALYGVKHLRTADKRRQTGGLKYFIADIDTTNPWITVDGIERHLSDVWDRGGRFDVLMARPSAFSALNNTEGVSRIQTVTIDDSRRGRVRAETVITEMGEVTLVRNRWVRKTDAFGFSRRNFSRRVLRPMMTFPLAKTDDTDTWAIVTEQGFQVKGQDHMVQWSALDPDAEMPTELV